MPEKQITIENLQAELASLTAERDALKAENEKLGDEIKSLNDSKSYWVDSSNRYEKRVAQLSESLCGLRAVIDGIIGQKQ